MDPAYGPDHRNRSSPPLPGDHADAACPPLPRRRRRAVVPPTGAKGLNLAIADVTLLARALGAWKRGDESLANAYSDTALRRVWRAAEFSWSWSSALHTTGDAFGDQLQLAQLGGSLLPSGGAGLAENFSGVPIAFA